MIKPFPALALLLLKRGIRILRKWISSSWEIPHWEWVLLKKADLSCLMACHHYQARRQPHQTRYKKSVVNWFKVKIDLTHIAELYLQDLNPFKHSGTRATKARELMMLTLAGPMTLTSTFPPVSCCIPHCANLFMNMYVPLALNSPIFTVQGDATLRNTLVLSFQGKPFLFHSGLAVSFVSTPTTRWTQSQASSAF